jgi:hypothetical protein
MSLFARKRPIKHRYSITSSARASRVGWHFESECFGGLKVDDQLQFRDLLNWQIAGLLALKNTPGIHAKCCVGYLKASTVAHEPASGSLFEISVYRRDAVAGRQRDELSGPTDVVGSPPTTSARSVAELSWRTPHRFRSECSHSGPAVLGQERAPPPAPVSLQGSQNQGWPN